jgi:hypothetical protein
MMTPPVNVFDPERVTVPLPDFTTREDPAIGDVNTPSEFSAPRNTEAPEP